MRRRHRLGSGSDVARRLILASASAARLRLLHSAGIRPEVMVSGVSEALPATFNLGTTGGLGTSGPDTRAAVATLAERKAAAVLPRAGGALVIGCDSMLEFDGQAHGKPIDAEEAFTRWCQMRGGRGRLFTGHCLIDGADGRQVSATEVTTVFFASPSDAEIAAYVATGEPLGVAGAFTLDGLSAPFIRAIEGDPSNVIGLSLPLFREMLGGLGFSIIELWS